MSAAAHESQSRNSGGDADNDGDGLQLPTFRGSRWGRIKGRQHRSPAINLPVATGPVNREFFPSRSIPSGADRDNFRDNHRDRPTFASGSESQ
jgi:hypothetical protein